MSNDENKCDKIQPSTITKNKNVQSIENVVTPEVKILNRGDLLGAINCLFPEMQLKSGRQKKQHTCEKEPRKRCDPVSFQSSYNDFVTKFLESHFPDRFVDFKNIECVILELNNLLKEMSKESKIGPFNPNLPVLNISECDKVVRSNSGSNKDILKTKTSASTKRICSKRKSRSRTQIEAKGRRKKSIRKRRSTRQMKIKIPNYSDDENGNEIQRNIESLLRDDTFSPRYKAKHTSDMFVIFRKPLNGNDTTIFTTLEKEAIEQYENIDDDLEMNFNLLEIEDRPQ